jgi:hypothetical protein
MPGDWLGDFATSTRGCVGQFGRPGAVPDDRRSACGASLAHRLAALGQTPMEFNYHMPRLK